MGVGGSHPARMGERVSRCANAELREVAAHVLRWSRRGAQTGTGV